VLETAELSGKALQDLDERDLGVRVKVANCAVASGRVGLRGSGAGRGEAALGRDVSGDDVREPGVQTFGGGIDSGVRAVNSHASLSKIKKSRLLRVFVGDRLETREDERI
jgi:hypothetical protein